LTPAAASNRILTGMRRFVAIAHVLALLMAFLRAPSIHLHGGHEHRRDEPGHQGLNLAFHAHLDLEHLSPVEDHHDQAQWHAPRDGNRPRWLSFLLLKDEVVLILADQFEERAWLLPPASIGLAAFQLLPRIHDPPCIDSSIPRSPPA